MDYHIVVVVSALGAQGAGVVSALTSPELQGRYYIRALTSNVPSNTAVTLAAFKGATFIFANTVFDVDTFDKRGTATIQLRGQQQGLNIVRAASRTQSLRHLIWSTLPGDSTIGYVIPAYQAKIPAEGFARTAENGLAEKTAYLRVGFHGSNVKRSSYRPVSVEAVQKHLMIIPCSSNAEFPFIGDERVNVGHISRAIFEQPDKILDRVILGYTEMMSCQGWVTAINRSLIRQGKEFDVAFMGYTQEAYKTLWGAWGAALALMLTSFRDLEYGHFHRDTFSHDTKRSRGRG